MYSEGEGKIVYVGDYDYGEASVRMTEDILNDQFPWKAKSANAAVERVVEPVTDNLNEETALKTASAPFLNAPSKALFILLNQSTKNMTIWKCLAKELFCFVFLKFIEKQMLQASCQVEQKHSNSIMHYFVTEIKDKLNRN